MNWNLICYLLENFSISKKKRGNFKRADYILFLDAQALKPENGEQKKTEGLPFDRENVVYVADASVSCSLKHALLITTGTVPDGTERYILLGSGTPGAVLNALLKAKSHLEILSSLLTPVTDNQEAISIAGSYLDVPLFYFDASYRLLAITGNQSSEQDPEWDHMSRKRFLSLESIRRMQESGDLDLLAAQHEPFPYKASYFPFESLVCNIRRGGRFFSRFNMLCPKGKPNELQIEECRIICSHLLRIAESGDPQGLSSGPVGNLVLDLLRGISLSDELIRDRLSHFQGISSSLVQVCCIEANVKNDPQVLSYYSSLIQRLFSEDRAVVQEFEEKIVLILHAPDAGAFKPLHAKLEDLLKTQSLKGGASTLFMQFHTLRNHYLQALAALSDDRHSVGMVYFEDIYFDYILSFIPRDQATAMISNDILLLRKLQKEYQFPLTDTLKTWLETGCNLNAAASQLYIHKNTALYRLNHIRELMQSDLEDPEQRLRLLFSFKILEHYPLSQ